MESLVFSLTQHIQLDTDISFPFSRHEGILKVLEEVGKGESFEFIIMNRDPVLPDVTFQHGHDFDCLFVSRNFLVGDVIKTPSDKVTEDFGAEFTVV